MAAAGGRRARAGGRRVGPAAVAKGAVVALMVALIAWRVDWTEAAGSLGAGSVLPLAAALAAFTLAGALKAVIWAGVLRGLAPRAAVRARELLPAVFIGLLGNWVAPARLGEAARTVLALRRLRRRGAEVAGSAIAGGVIAEILVSTVAWALLTLLIALLLPVPAYVGAVAAAVAVGGAAMLLVALREAPRARQRPAPRGRVTALLRTGADALRSARAALRGLASPRSLVPVGAAALAAVALQWVAIGLVLWALGLGVGLAAAAAVLATTTVAQAFPVLPGGVGSFQAAVALPLVATYDVSAADAIAVAVLLHAAQAATAIVPGMACLAREDLDLASLRALGGRAPVAPKGAAFQAGVAP
ncbi:MAG TPA: lysylphosphatidylglycerol synthase domain-containing protein [Miltoncostaeaceae bacterium]|nr:lysylphosphatidylglycerol synthase domain-containing protein [Miltoncostaeaceae bacterium]